MEGNKLAFPIIIYSFLFFAYIYFVLNAVRKYLFSRDYGWFTYVVIFIYQLILPLVYSIFSVGSTVLMYLTFTERVPLKWAAPFFYILFGFLFFILPYFQYTNRKIRLYLIALTIFWITVGIGISMINPIWNDQLERSIHITMPTIGLFLILTNSSVLAVIAIYYGFDRTNFIKQKKV